MKMTIEQIAALPAEEKNERIHQILGLGTTYVLIKNGYYYRTNSAGYTASILEAGRYTEEEAIRREYHHGHACEWVKKEPLPPLNYSGSLDAMAEAEESKGVYRHHDKTGSTIVSQYWHALNALTAKSAERSLHCATADQRATAFIFIHQTP